MNSTDNTKEPKLDIVRETRPLQLSNKMVRVAIVLVLLVEVVIGGWYIGIRTQTAQTNQTIPSPILSPDESGDMEGWETYVNEEYGFSFKYPSDWFEYQDEQHINYGTTAFFKVATTPLYSQGGHMGNELVTLYVKDSLLSLEDYGKELAKMQNITEFFPLEIGGQPAVEYYDEYYSNSRYVVNNNNNFLHIIFHNSTSNTIDQILSTFEFVK